MPAFTDHGAHRYGSRLPSAPAFSGVAPWMDQALPRKPVLLGFPDLISLANLEPISKRRRPACSPRHSIWLFREDHGIASQAPRPCRLGFAHRGTATAKSTIRAPRSLRRRDSGAAWRKSARPRAGAIQERSRVVRPSPDWIPVGITRRRTGGPSCDDRFRPGAAPRWGSDRDSGRPESLRFRGTGHFGRDRPHRLCRTRNHPENPRR